MGGRESKWERVEGGWGREWRRKKREGGRGERHGVTTVGISQTQLQTLTDMHTMFDSPNTFEGDTTCLVWEPR